MGKGINIPLVADVSGFLSGTQDVEQSLDSVGSSLDELAREGDTAGEKLESSFREAFDSVRTDADKMHKDVGDSIDRTGTEGGSRAKEAGGEIGQELASNIGEGIGSGQIDIADSLQGTLGGLASVPGLGLAAIGAGLGLAVVKGIVTRIGAAKKELAETTQRVFDAIEVDGSTLQIKWDRQKMLDDAIDNLTEGDASADLQQIQDWIAKGIGQKTIAHALAGDLTPEEMANLREVAATTEEIKGSRGEIRTIASKEADAAQRVLDIAIQQAAAQDAASVKAGLLRDIYKEQKDYNEGINTAIRTRPTVDMNGNARPGTRWDD